MKRPGSIRIGFIRSGFSGVAVSLLAAAFWLGSCVPPVFGGVQEGVDAYLRRDYAAAYKEFKAEADRGVPQAQNNLGVMYSAGQGVAKNPAEAARWFLRAAEQGNGDAQKNLAFLYMNGEGLPKNYVEAARWFRKAAEQGNGFAQNNLGVMYAQGQGVAKDPALAEKWFRRAGEQGLPEARKNLAALLKERAAATPREAGKLSGVVYLEKAGGTYFLPVRVNDAITTNFLLDTGSAEVNIPEDLVSKLQRSGAIVAGDFLPGRLYRMADGSMVQGARLMLRKVSVGGVTIKDVPASVVPGHGSPLLGQSFLERLASWSLDNRDHALRLSGR